jgi:DNA-binding transcriptional LysR family regulator
MSAYPSVPDLWLGVEPRHLATFAAVADAGSFRAAATSLGYVQSAVSQQIAQLERALGTSLIDRGQSNRSLLLTPAGRTLLAHARRIVDQVRAACADVAYLSAEGLIRVAFEPAAGGLVPGLARSLARAGGDVALAVSEMSAPDVARSVAAGEVDVGVGAFGDLRDGISRHLIRNDRWVLVVPEDDALVHEGRHITHAELDAGTLIEHRPHPLPADLASPREDRTISCDRLSIALNLVRAGAGRAILPSLAVPESESGVRVLELADRLPRRAVSIIWLTARRLPGQLAQVASGYLDDDERRSAGEVTVAA